MKMELQNKNIIYLGGFGGIGKKCIEEFLKKDIQNLIIFDLREDSQVLKYLQDTYKSCMIHYIPVDVTKSESIAEAFKQAKEKLDYIDLVVNGCGLMNDTHLDLTIDINLVSFHIKIINKAHIIRIQIVFFFNLSVVLL